MPFNFNPIDGLLNTDIFPSDPMNDTAARQQFMTLFNQIKEKLNSMEEQLNTPGQIMFFAKNTPPTGWLKCDGSAVSRTTYNGLFSIIGTTFGNGDGSTTFNLPDLRGEFIRGWDNGRGIDSGRAFGSAQTDSLKSHTHNLTVRDGATGFGSDLALTKASGSGGTNMSQSIDAAGDVETRPRNVALLPCIKI